MDCLLKTEKKNAFYLVMWPFGLYKPKQSNTPQYHATQARLHGSWWRKARWRQSESWWRIKQVEIVFDDIGRMFDYYHRETKHGQNRFPLPLKYILSFVSFALGSHHFFSHTFYIWKIPSLIWEIHYSIFLLIEVCVIFCLLWRFIYFLYVAECSGWRRHCFVERKCVVCFLYTDTSQSFS